MPDLRCTSARKNITVAVSLDMSSRITPLLEWYDDFITTSSWSYQLMFQPDLMTACENYRRWSAAQTATVLQQRLKNGRITMFWLLCSIHRWSFNFDSSARPCPMSPYVFLYVMTFHVSLTLTRLHSLIRKKEGKGGRCLTTVFCHTLNAFLQEIACSIFVLHNALNIALFNSHMQIFIVRYLKCLVEVNVHR